MDKRILFVCLGNICRSPAAEAVMKDKIRKAGLENSIQVDSAGTYGGHAGENADPRMREAAARRNYQIDHLSRQLRMDDFDRYDLIIVMDDANYDQVYKLAPDCDAAEKIHPMSDFFEQFDSDHVPDPYYEGREGFEKVLDLLEDGCEGILNYLLDQDD